MEVRVATAADFERVYPLLREFPDTLMTRDDWRRMLFDLPWPVEESQRGFMLCEGDEVVGFYATILSRRTIGGVRRRICHLSSWIVRPSHRSASMQLLPPILAMRDHTLINVSPNDISYRIFARLGFRTLEDAYLLVAPLPRARELVPGPVSVTTRLEAIRAALDPEQREIADHMAGTLAGQALLRVGDRLCHVIATRSPWKGSLRLAHVHHASDWPLFWEHVGRVSAAFAGSIGSVGLRVESRHLSGSRPLFSRVRPIPSPMVFRPAEQDLTAEMLDGLYTDLVSHRW